MKKSKLPFELGTDYEHLEFDLEVIEYERIPNYDSYLYIGEVKNFLNIISDKTELIFCLDTLVAVIMEFHSENYYGISKTLEQVKLEENVSMLLSKHNSGLIILIYGYSNVLRNLTLLW